MPAVRAIPDRVVDKDIVIALAASKISLALGDVPLRALQILRVEIDFRELSNCSSSRLRSPTEARHQPVRWRRHAVPVGTPGSDCSLGLAGICGVAPVSPR